VRAASHRKAGYLARRLTVLWEYGLMPFEILVAVFPNFRDIRQENLPAVFSTVVETKVNLDRIALETRDVKLQESIEKAQVIIDSCLGYVVCAQEFSPPDQQLKLQN
jgi:hypothetical protein